MHIPFPLRFGTRGLALAATVAASVLCLTPAFADDAPPALQELKFRDFFATPIGRAGLAPTPKLLAANGQRVRIVGYMVAEEAPPTGRFFLTPLPVRMSEHADGEADDLPPSTVVVTMPPGDDLRPLSHTPGLMALTGTLDAGRVEASDGRVSWVRLRLEPAADAHHASLTYPSPSKVQP